MSCPKCFSQAIIETLEYSSIFECCSCGFKGNKYDMRYREE